MSEDLTPGYYIRAAEEGDNIQLARLLYIPAPNQALIEKQTFDLVRKTSDYSIKAILYTIDDISKKIKIIRLPLQDASQFHSIFDLYMPLFFYKKRNRGRKHPSKNPLVHIIGIEGLLETISKQMQTKIPRSQQAVN